MRTQGLRSVRSVCAVLAAAGLATALGACSSSPPTPTPAPSTSTPAASTTWAAWRSGAPVWQNLLDFDALGAAEGTPWVCVELDILYPDGDRALITLSPGGSDALVVREFDIDARRFVDDGFVIAKAGKHTASWIDRDTLYVGWDNGRKTLTRSGYPREVRRWTRGSALAEAPVVFKGAFGDIGVEAHYDPVERRHTVVSSVDFFDSHTYYLDGADADAGDAGEQ